MVWWVYKCNSNPNSALIEGHSGIGDWREFFDGGHTDHWGNTESTRDIELLRRGDIILAYQTNRNELVGTARVVQSYERDTFVYFKPLERIERKVRPLKKRDPQIASIPALKGGRIQALYEISESDAHRLLRAASAKQLPSTSKNDKANKERTFLEGEKHATKNTVRSAALRIAAKERWGIKCYCCGFDFGEFYGDRARGFAIVHHLQLFGKNEEKRKATVEDVRVVCANCHYAMHLTRSPMSIDDFKKVVSKSWRRWSENGIGRKR